MCHGDALAHSTTEVLQMDPCDMRTNVGMMPRQMDNSTAYVTDFPGERELCMGNLEQELDEIRVIRLDEART